MKNWAILTSVILSYVCGTKNNSKEILKTSLPHESIYDVEKNSFFIFRINENAMTLICSESYPKIKETYSYDFKTVSIENNILGYPHPLKISDGFKFSKEHVEYFLGSNSIVTEVLNSKNIFKAKDVHFTDKEASDLKLRLMNYIEDKGKDILYNDILYTLYFLYGVDNLKAIIHFINEYEETIGNVFYVVDDSDYGKNKELIKLLKIFLEKIIINDINNSPKRVFVVEKEAMFPLSGDVADYISVNGNDVTLKFVEKNDKKLRIVIHTFDRSDFDKILSKDEGFSDYQEGELDKNIDWRKVLLARCSFEKFMYDNGNMHYSTEDLSYWRKSLKRSIEKIKEIEKMKIFDVSEIDEKYKYYVKIHAFNFRSNSFIIFYKKFILGLDASVKFIQKILTTDEKFYASKMKPLFRAGLKVEKDLPSTTENSHAVENSYFIAKSIDNGYNLVKRSCFTKYCEKIRNVLLSNYSTNFRSSSIREAVQAFFITLNADSSFYETYNMSILEFYLYLIENMYQNSLEDMFINGYISLRSQYFKYSDDLVKADEKK